MCDYPEKIKDKRIVDLFDVDSDCPKNKKKEEK